MRMTIAALLLSLAAATATAQQVPVDDSFEAGVVSFGRFGDFYLLAAPRNVGGKVGICALTFSDATSSRMDALRSKIVERFYFRLGGEPVRVNNNRFAHARSEAEAMQSQARCAVSRRNWTPELAGAEFEMDARFSRPIRY